MYTSLESSFGGDGTGTNSGWEYTLAAGQVADSVFQGVPTNILTAVGANQNTVGPDASSFAWTWAGASGALSGLGL